MNDLRRFELAQEIHKAVHGQFALTTEQLSEGDIHFHECRIPTTNDLNLRPDLRRKR